jgi:hypothetical protein
VFGDERNEPVALELGGVADDLALGGGEVLKLW